MPDEVKQKIIGVLDRVGTLTNLHEKYARIALKLVSDIPNPRILELGAGHGKLSAKILELHPTATVTISDLDPTSVANIAAGELGTHPRARTQVIDATAIDGHDHSYDLAVFALAFHHLPPTVACKAIAEATRVGKRFLIIDLKRQKPLSFTLSSVLLLPLHLLLLPWSSMRSSMHDGFISALRAYTPSALQTLARAADPGMQVEILPAPTRLFPHRSPLCSPVRAQRQRNLASARPIANPANDSVVVQISHRRYHDERDHDQSNREVVRTTPH